ncbi:hypothetical protein Emag_007210 [Eimeria magna]
MPEQLTSGLIAIRNTSDRPLHLSAGWPLARTVQLPPAAVHNVRLAAADPAPAPANGAGETPAYEKVSGGLLPTLPSPNSCLLPAELRQLLDLLHEFRNRFNDGSKPLPATFLLKARLDTGDAQPISTPPRRLSPAIRQVVRDAVAELDAQGISEPSTGCWTTLIVMVRKALGAWRLCCDNRAINKHIRIPQQPLPRTDDILASFNGKKYFSVTDSPAIFQRMVDLLLGGMKWVSAVGCVDDIIVYSDTWDAHRAHLRQLFQALRAAKLQLHAGKCSFGAAAVRHLEHIVSRDGIKPCPSRVQAILEMPVPKTAKAVQRFSSNASTIVSSFPISPSQLRLYFMQPGDRGISLGRLPPTPPWLALCKALSSEPVVAHPDYTRPFYLGCDGSGDSLGAVLLQPYDEDHERKWTATEPEAAALIWALETFRHYIDTVEACIRTDHAPLEYIRHNNSQCRRLERWALRLQEFRFKVLHRPGAQQRHVDCLSRAPLPPTRTRRPLILDEFPARRPLPIVVSSVVLCSQPCGPQSAPADAPSAAPFAPPVCGSPRLRPSYPASHSGSEDEAHVRVCLTDSEDESHPPPTAQPSNSAPTKVIHGERNIPLTPAVEHLSLKDAQAQDPECQEFLRRARTPRAAWPS